MGSGARNNPFSQWKKSDAVSTTKAYDRSGRELQQGDVVHLMGKTDIVWRVHEVRPLLNPDAPPGLVELIMTAAFITALPGGTPISDLIKVKDASEASPGLPGPDPRSDALYVPPVGGES